MEIIYSKVIDYKALVSGHYYLCEFKDYSTTLMLQFEVGEDDWYKGVNHHNRFFNLVRADGTKIKSYGINQIKNIYEKTSNIE